MATVFGSRLMPLVSFDMISYAAGLSRLHIERFALTTLAGIVPESFLLAQFGTEAVSGGLGRATWAVSASARDEVAAASGGDAEKA